MAVRHERGHLSGTGSALPSSSAGARLATHAGRQDPSLCARDRGQGGPDMAARSSEIWWNSSSRHAGTGRGSQACETRGLHWQCQPEPRGYNRRRSRGLPGPRHASGGAAATEGRRRVSLHDSPPGDSKMEEGQRGCDGEVFIIFGVRPYMCADVGSLTRVYDLLRKTQKRHMVSDADDAQLSAHVSHGVLHTRSRPAHVLPRSPNGSRDISTRRPARRPGSRGSSGAAVPHADRFGPA
ncbi:hypothetical protein P4O66_004127 [Electrophorus voltai]|uniref:Uncharacterized protein n=1 Tax=Electrophorus voltai TaxID=2609070 RepID=A0AAD8ZQI6_9TELE|nr:hypothetical protein P4O66_004127 [Electrophorus voltai]